MRVAAGPGSLPRPLPGAPRGTSAASRRLGGCSRMGAAGRGVALPSRRRSRAVGEAFYQVGEIQRCAASSPNPKKPIARRANGVAARDQGWLNCGWPRDGSRRPTRRSAAMAEEVHEPGPRARVLDAYVEIVLAAGDFAAAAPPPRNSRRSPYGWTFRSCVPCRPARPERCFSPRAMPRRRWPNSGDPGVCGRELQAPYEAARVRVTDRTRMPNAGRRGGCTLELMAARQTFQQSGRRGGPCPWKTLLSEERAQEPPVRLPIGKCRFSDSSPPA